MIASNDPSICPDGYHVSLGGDCRIVLNNPSSGATSTKNSSSTASTPITSSHSSAVDLLRN